MPDQIPGSLADVYFGDAEKGAANWRENPEASEPSDEDEASPEQRESVESILGFSIDEICGEDGEE